MNKQLHSFFFTSVLMLLIVVGKLNAQVTQTFFHTQAEHGMQKSSSNSYSAQASGSFAVGNHNTDDAFRGYIVFNISSIPSSATITSASLNLKPTQSVGKTNSPTSTISFKNMMSRPTAFNWDADWTLLNGASEFTSVNATVNTVLTISSTALNTKIKNSISEGFLYFGLVNSAELSKGLLFSSNDADLFLSVTYTVPISSAPTNLQASEVTSSGCKLSWTKPSGVVSGYKVYRNNVYVKSVSTTTTTIENLNSNTLYSFTVNANNAGGQSLESIPSNVTTLPNAPTNLMVSNIRATSCDLAWTAPTGVISQYKIYQNGSLIQTVTSANALIKNLSQGTPYTFTVSAIGGGGESAQGSGLPVTTGTLPSVPANLNYYNLTGTSCIVAWNPSSGVVTGYKLYQRFPTTAQFTTTSTGIFFNNLQPGVGYAFTIAAYNEYGEVLGSTIGFTVPAPLSAPTNLIASNVTAIGCTLSWTVPSGSISGYRIYQNGILVKSSSANSTIISGLTSSTAYTFTVSAYNVVGESPVSNTAVISTPVLTVPSVPTNLLASNISTGGCTLSWTSSTGIVSGYNVYQNGVQINTTSTTGTTVSGLSPSSSYTFIVKAFNSAGVSNESNSAIVNTPSVTIPSPPTNLRVAGATSSSTTLAWNAPAGVVIGYYLYVNVGSTNLGKVTLTSTTYSFNGVGTYNFYVTAYNALGESAKSNVVTFTRTSSSSSAKRSGFDTTDSAVISESENVVLYPNPVIDNLFISGISDSEVLLYDLNGVQINNIFNRLGVIDLSEVKQGTYIIKLRTADKTIIRRIEKR